MMPLRRLPSPATPWPLRRRRMLAALAAAVACLVLGACEVHQFPEQQDVYPPEPGPDTVWVTVPLRLVYDLDVYLWPHRYDPLLASVEPDASADTPFPDRPGASDRYANLAAEGVIVTHVQALAAAGTARVVTSRTFTRTLDGTPYDTDSIALDVPAGGVYDLYVWSHLLADTAAAPFYDYTDFNRVHLVADSYDGNTDYRDAFRGTVRVEAPAPAEADTAGSATGDVEPYVVGMKRPMGKFELITTDLSEFLERETVRRSLTVRADVGDYRVVISYPMYYPASYSAIEDRLENVYTGMQFSTRMTVTGDSEASLGFDYVLLNNVSDAGVQVVVNVYDLGGARVAGSATFTVPMRRDYHTRLRGAFLSTPGNGGVGIDPGFNGDHNVTW